MLKNILVFLAISNLSLIASAQTAQKIGFADIEYIHSQLPASKKVQDEINALREQLSKQYEIKQAEFTAKYKEFTSGSNKTIDVQENTVKELQVAKDNLSKFEQDAQATVEKKYQELTVPLFKMISDAIKAVGKENGFMVIINPKLNGMDAILFTEERHDISDLVLKKLGVTPQPRAN